MGFDQYSARFLITCVANGVSFDRVLTIGRQEITCTPGALGRAFSEFGIHLTRARSRRLFADGGGYAEPLLELLGAGEVESLDASPFEGATVVHDLNDPVPDEMKGVFSVVIDSGSLEHVFDVPHALKNCLEMVAEGGHFLALAPADGSLGHGFYQFSPEFYYRALSPGQGFDVEAMYLKEMGRGPWYAVADPADVGMRVEGARRKVAYLYVQARRLDDRVPLSNTPQQSDYVTRWGGGRREPTRELGTLRRIRRWIWDHLPLAVRLRYTPISRRLRGRFDRRVFRPVDLRRFAADARSRIDSAEAG